MPVSPSISTYEGLPNDLLASGQRVIATYTVDKDYVATSTLVDGSTREILWEGQILGFNPATKQVVPQYSTYGFPALGVLYQRVDVTDGDAEAAVIWRGDVIESFCTDEGTYGTVQAATKTSLADRIQFVVQKRL